MTTDRDGTYVLSELNDESEYLMIIEGADGSRMALSDMFAGQTDRSITLPKRQDLVISVTGDISSLPKRMPSGKPSVSVRQQISIRTPEGAGSSGYFGADIPLELNANGGAATFRGLIIDPPADLNAAQVEVSLGYSNDLKKTVRIEPESDTKVTFELPPAQTGTLAGRISVESTPPQRPKLRVPTPDSPLLSKQPTNEQRTTWEASLVEIDDESLLVDAELGLANAFVYLAKQPSSIEASRTRSSEPVTIHMKDFGFSPRATVIQTTQDLVLDNSGRGPNGFRFDPFKNSGQNRLVDSGEKTTLEDPFTSPETIPVQANSDIAVWKKTFLLPVDHPFAAVTDAQGRFSIQGLPPGEHQFRIWHERAGWLEKSLTVSVKAGETTPLEQSYNLDRFHLASNPINGAAVQDTAKATVVGIRYPYCLVNTKGPAERSLLEAISSFNLMSQESPTGVLQPPITEHETRDAMAKFAAEKHVPEAVRTQLEQILKSGELPSNVYFRRFTRFDDGKEMHGVWSVRLVVETNDGPVYSVPVRSRFLYSRPYTQMERRQNADGMTLINRVASYYEEPPVVIKPSDLPAASVETLIRKTQEAIKAEDDTAIRSLFESAGASETQMEFAVSELKSFPKAKVHSIKVSPLKLKGDLRTWSAWQYYKPNLPVVGFLEIEYEGKDAATRRADAQPLAEERKILSLELGLVGEELRLVNYVPDGERTPPESLNPGPSITGHLEPLADGSHLVTDIITNPGSLLSGHVANEEVRRRDFRQPESTEGAEDANDAKTDEPEQDKSGAAEKQNPPQQLPVPPQPLSAAQRRDIILKAVADADRIPDEKARQQAQWNLVSSLVNAGLREEAFQQALKLRLANPQTCIYSLKTIAEDAIKRGHQTTVQKAWDAAKQANTESGLRYNHYVIELGFKLNRPIVEILGVADAAKRDGQQQAYRDIRNELAWRGRVDEAYDITARHLLNEPKDFTDREISFYCASARGYDYYLKHDHLGQAAGIIEKMPKGAHRDAAIGHLVAGLLYVANNDQVTEKNLALAETWSGRIDDKLKQAAARAMVLQKRLPGMSVDELEQQFGAVMSREEKLEYLRWIFQKLLEENRIEEADRILPRQMQLVKDQPRPEQKSKFGNVDDGLVEKMTAWNHHAAIVRALHKAGRTKEAKTRLESMKDLPDADPVFLVGNLAGIRLQLYQELEDFDAVEGYYAANPNPLSSIFMGAWMMNKGQFDRGWKHVAPLVDMSSETMFPPDVRSQSMYFLAQPFENLAKELFKVHRPDDALKFIGKLPESRDTAHAYETFGQLLVQSGRGAELDQWLARLPHETATTHARLGALREMTAPATDDVLPK